jgi:hypothetical protein
MIAMRIIIIGIVMSVISLTMGSDVWALGGGGTPTCQVGNPGAGAVAIRGVIVVETINASAPTEVDYLLRLERSGVVKFYRMRQFTPVNGLSTEEVVCRAVDPSGPEPGVVGPVVAAILADFAPGKTRLLITDKSVSNAESPGNNTVILNSNNAISAGDVILYAQ